MMDFVLHKKNFQIKILNFACKFKKKYYFWNNILKIFKFRCPINFHGAECEKLAAAGGTRIEAIANPNYLYISMGILFLFAIIFAALYGREKFVFYFIPILA